MDWSSLYTFSVPPLELVARGTLLYWFLLLIFRFVMRRGAGTVGIADVLLLVLIADASQNAMAGGYESVAEGFVLIGTLIGWNYLVDWAAFHWKAVQWLTEPPPLLLIRRGRIMHGNLRREHLTVDEVQAHLREHGVTSYDAVRAAFMESDGTFSVIRADGKATSPPPDTKRKVA